MTFGSFDDQTRAAPMAEINVTPMVDVMLVLLVIFILAAPLFTHAIRLDLPQAASGPAPTLPQTVTLSIDAAGRMFWNDEAIDAGTLGTRMAEAAHRQPAPDLQLRADRASRYEVIAKVMAAAQASGLTKIGFVTEPQPTVAPASSPANSTMPAGTGPATWATTSSATAAATAPAAIQTTPAAGLLISPALTHAAKK